MNIQTVPALEWDSNIRTAESSLFTMVDRCDRAFMCKSSSYINFRSSMVRSSLLYNDRKKSGNIM